MTTTTDWQEARRLDRAAEAEQRRLTTAANRAEDRRDRDHKAAEAEKRRVRRRSERGDKAMAFLWATMITLPITIAWQAQASFALVSLHIPSPMHHTFPAVIEVGAWLCAFEAHRRARRGLPAGSLPRWMWTLAGVAAAINGAHGWRDGGPVVGFTLAVVSLLGVLLHSIRQRLSMMDATGSHDRPVWLAVWRRVRYPRLSLAALSLRAARELDAATAWYLAWVDRYGVGPDAPRRDRQLARLIVRAESTQDRKAARDGELMIVNGTVQRDYSADVQAFVDAERAAAIEQANHAATTAQAVVDTAQDALTAAGLLFGPDRLRDTHAALPPAYTAPEQGELSGRAADLLPELRTAIESGEVPANPSVDRIRAWVRAERDEGLGVPAAQDLRDAVRGLRAVKAEQADAELAVTA